LIKLVDPNAVYGDPSNPRETDPARLEVVKLSLLKFGFLLPLYANQDGMLSSGHQRVTAAESLGWQVPVEYHSGQAGRSAGLNLTFNRATNDFALTDIQHDKVPAEELVRALLELPDTEQPFPCMQPQVLPVPDLLARNADLFERYAANAARQLDCYGIKMPLVVTRSGRVINGIGRLMQASSRREPTVNCTVLPEDMDADLASFVLNRLSMDFRFSGAFREVLQSNAYRRARQRRRALGSGFLFPLGVRRCKDFSPTKQKKSLADLFGDRVLDFGSGRGDEARILRKVGLKVTTFEPYRSTGPKPSVLTGRRSARSFLKAVGSGEHFSSIVLSSVLNSVPFPEDRKHIITICAALFGEGTRLYAAARSLEDPNWKECSAGIGLGVTASRSARFVLTDEPGTSIAELNDAPKVQKFFSPGEFEELFKARFKTVEIGSHINNVTAICADPLPVDRDALRAALEFEFNLPYPDGRMDMVDHALDAFGKRLGGTL
jgi:hypothetical protein